MSPRPQYAYRLHVEYPDEPINAKHFYDEFGEELPWRWPVIRTYLSRKTADKRAVLLRHYGCTVAVEQSERIVWPS